MGLTVKEVAGFMEEWAPLSLAESYDNCGLLVGSGKWKADRVMLAVDASESVIEQAVKEKADLLLTHHPMIFHPLKSVTDDTRDGRRILNLAEHHIALYAAHTNLDSAPGGNIDRTCAALGLTEVKAVAQNDEIPCLRIGTFEKKMTLREVGKRCEKVFGIPHAVLFGPEEKGVSTAAVCTGSGMDFADLALQEGADVFITGDITYHRAEASLSEGLLLVDATHFATDRLSLCWIRTELLRWASSRGEEMVVMTANEEDPGKRG